MAWTPEELSDRRKAQRAARRRRRVGSVLALAVLCLVGAVAVTMAATHRHHRVKPKLATPGATPAKPQHAETKQARQARRERAAVQKVAKRMPYVSVAGSQKREIALTFDDGPGPYTPAILKVLRRTHTPATFFQVGAMIPDFPKIERDLIADKNMVLADHTENHANLRKLTAKEQYGQLNDAGGQQAILGAPRPRLMRPPYGTFNDDTIAVAKKLHQLIVLWTVDSDDYLQPGVDVIVKRVLDGAKPGAIVLFHDAGGTRTQTAAALPIVIRKLRARGYKLVTVPRLLLDNPPRQVGQTRPDPPGS
jgi:peptidoglycan-N-acetylglucosamine deacetylase